MNAINAEDYDHAVKPFNHQLEHINKHWKTTAWGLFWEQGTAKTKPIIDTACLLYLNKEIDGLVVVAPPGVERNWNTDEIPKHIHPDVALETMIAVFLTAKKDSKEQIKLINHLMKYQGLAVLLISYNAFMTQKGKDTVWKFLRHRRCLYVLDEAHNIKSPNAKRTKSIIASGRYASHKRILTGTPIAVGPFDVYSQIRFLDENFWKSKGIHGSVAFRQHFGEWFTRAECQQQLGYDPGYDKLIRYKNLEQLALWLSEITDRVLKDDVLDLPPKLYSKHYVEMTREQKAIYNELKEEYIYDFGDGDIIDGELPIVRLLRFQQILCNYVPVGEDEPVRLLGSVNPRLQAMETIRDSLYHPAIVWARFRHDIDQIVDLLGDKAVRYDGAISGDQAEINKKRFQDGEVQWFVGNAQKGSTGLTLTQAKTVIYYSNSFKLLDRLQSEDRAHRGGMDDNPVNYIDIVCQGTVDERIVENLRDKRDIASTILGDELKDWI